MTPTTPSRSPARPGFNQFWIYLQSQPLPEPEDSVMLRVLVQLLAAIGIISIDIAAADTADPLWISLWAVPVSAVGGVWSWYRRRKRNVPVKFCIAIAMLLALGTFFVKLLGSSNDTRLALAELLIQLQVFHSFDLPRRKDLGYSTVIGLILLGVSATLSQTLAFAPLLLGFLAIAIPTLILDYRSRLGLTPQGLRRISADLAPKRVGLVLAVSIALGLMIFALLPRLPGYQLRTFPVSAPIQFEGQFDGGNIINPGYVREGRAASGSGGTGAGGTAPTGPGEVNKDFYYGFNSRMNQNLRGEMTPKTVMRVRSQAPGFWRVMAFDRYTGQGWEVSRNEDEQVQKIERPAWTFRFSLPWSVTLGRRREVVQSYTMVADLPNLLPALYEAKELYFPTRQIAVDNEGALRSPIPLSEGLTYTVVSEVPYRDRTLLRQSLTEYPSPIERFYLDLPTDLRERVRQKTEEILATAPNALNDPYEKSLYLTQYLKQNYTIQPDLPFLDDSEDLVEAFLFTYGGGYPDHFSTVLTVMLRSVGIPARIAVGFGPGEFNPFTGLYIVRNTDAFAITEVFFTKFGWFGFNPIPGMDLIPTTIEESQTFSVLKKFWEWIAGWLPSPLSGLINQVLEWIASAFGWVISVLSTLFSKGWLGLLIAAGAITGLSFVGWLSWSGWQTWRYQAWLNRLPAMEALYQQMLHWLSERGSPKRATQTPLEYADALRTDYSPIHSEVIDEISHAYMQWRYGGLTPNIPRLRQRLQTLKKRRSRSS